MECQQGINHVYVELHLIKDKVDKMPSTLSCFILCLQKYYGLVEVLKG
jgi:hypothetical protein